MYIIYIYAYILKTLLLFLEISIFVSLYPTQIMEENDLNKQQ